MAKSTKKKSKFKGKVSQNSQKQQKQGSQFGHLNLPKGISIFKEEPGDRASLDIMLYMVTDKAHPDRDDDAEIAVPGDLWYKRPYRLHRNIGVNNEATICPTSIGKKCPVCEYRAQRLKEGADYEEMRPLKPSLRNLYAVIPQGMKDYDEKVHIWDISQFLFQDSLNEEIEENEDNAAFPDLEEGFTLRIRFSKESFGNNNFAKTSRIDFQERDEQYDESILKQVPNLDEVLTVPSYKELEMKFFGMEDEPEPEEDVEEDTEEEEPEPEPEEKPKRKKKKAEPEPEEEEEPEPESEPEEKPKRKKKGKESKESKDRCPYGHRFGVDVDEYEDCDECEISEECFDAKEGE